MKAAFLLRILACVALVVSGLPLRPAVCKPAAMLGMAPLSQASSCPMPCCAAKPTALAAKASCCPGESVPSVHQGHRHEGHGLRSTVDADRFHGCAVDVKVAITDVVVATAPTVDDFEIAAVLPFASIQLISQLDPEPLARLRVGIAGLDAGPPQASPCLPDSGRSPPLSRL